MHAGNVKLLHLAEDENVATIIMNMQNKTEKNIKLFTESPLFSQTTKSQIHANKNKTSEICKLYVNTFDLLTFTRAPIT